MLNHSKNPIALCKERIQALVRALALARDEGCVLRHYPEVGQCGGYRQDGELILQFDHLRSRVHSISFGDVRLGVILCKRHHIFWKPQYPALFTKLIKQHIGKTRTALWERVEADRKPHPGIDWKLIELSLRQEVKKL